jgi:hypothetical protein
MLQYSKIAMVLNHFRPRTQLRNLFDQLPFLTHVAKESLGEVDFHHTMDKNHSVLIVCKVSAQMLSEKEPQLRKRWKTTLYQKSEA